MNITNNTSPSFGAKFRYSYSLKMVADYAVARGKFNKLNEARKNIEKLALKTRIRLDIAKNDKGFPVLLFSRFEPKKNVLIAYNAEDYFLAKTIKIEASKKSNPLNFALNNIIKMGNNNAQNKIFNRVILNKK